MMHQLIAATLIGLSLMCSITVILIVLRANRHVPFDDPRDRRGWDMYRELQGLEPKKEIEK